MGAMAEFELGKPPSEHAQLETWSVHAQTMSIYTPNTFV